MPAPVLNEIERQEKAIQLLASGLTKQAVADQLEISRPVVSQFAAKNREKIEKAAQEYLNVLPNFIEQDINEILNSGELSKELIQLLKEESVIQETKDGKAVELFQSQRAQAIQKFLEYTSKKVTDLKRSIGILPALTPSIVFNQLNLLGNQSSDMSPALSRLLGAVNQDQDTEVDIED